MDPSILIVDDDRQVADLYSTWLAEYETGVAYDGESALEAIEREAPDVVFLDRRMPGMTGDEVLERIRARGHDCWVTMVTAVDPEVEVLDLPVNNYVVKPVSRYQLLRLVETIRIRTQLDEQREYVSLTNRIETVERRHEDGRLRDDDTYQAALDRLRRMADQLADGDGDPETA